MKAVTIYDIANEAGVSPATVSRVINSSASVSAEKEAKIKEIIDKYQFRPNAIATGLKTKSSKTIGFIVPDIKNTYFAQIFYELQVRAKQKDYMVFLCNTENDRQVESKILHALLDNQVEIVVMMGGRIDDFPINSLHLRELIKINKKVPLVLTSRTPEIDCIQLINDDRGCMRQVVQHLASKGHTDIALVGGNDTIKPSYYRRRYFLEIMEEYHMNIRDEWLIDSELTMAGGIEAFTKLWACKQKPTAVCGINDMVAMGLLNACHKKKIQVPKQLAIIGCDGVPETEFSIPALTTVATDYEFFGQTILDYILKEDKPKVGKCIKVPMKIIVREST
ncbi:MAG: LacI family DNA-binding transcriptional regulator [Cellulosilyticaceae bacterium]